MIIAELVGFCLFAIIFSVVANKQAGKGKKYKNTLIAGIVLYAIVALGAIVGGMDPVSLIGCIISFIMLGVMFPVCAKKALNPEE